MHELVHLEACLQKEELFCISCSAHSFDYSKLKIDLYFNLIFHLKILIILHFLVFHLKVPKFLQFLLNLLKILKCLLSFQIKVSIIYCQL